MTMDDFQIVGIWQVVTESLNRAVRYLRWKMLSLSGPKAFELLQLLIASATLLVVNVTAVSIDSRQTSHDTNQGSGVGHQK